MYYPYFRGKQFELILLRDYSEFMVKNNIHPIIEPVKHDFTSLIRTVKSIKKSKLDFTLIINPKVSKDPVPENKILNELINVEFKDYDNLSLGYIMDSESEIGDLENIIEKYINIPFTIIHNGFTNGSDLSISVEKYNNIKRHVFIDKHRSKLYQRNFKKDGIKRILIKDGFNSQVKNAHYPFDEHFSDLHIIFEDEEGMDGFGDYLIVGEEYNELGGPAYAVAIHLTYIDILKDSDMFIYHFISDQTDSPVDPGGKFLEALTKLVNETNKKDSKIYKSNAIHEYLELYKKQHYPGLGYVKKLSMQHHIELIADYFNRNI